jgi:hypothetical protein
MAAGLRYIVSARTAQKSQLPTITPLLRVTQPLLSNGCFSGSTVLTRGRVCRLPESPSAVISLLSVCKIYILQVIKYMRIQHIQVQGSVKQIVRYH